MTRKVMMKDADGKQIEVALKPEMQALVDSDTKLTDADGVFFQRQLEVIESATYDVLYPDLEARECFINNTLGGAGAQVLTYRSYDRIGKAQVINARATDLPKSDISGKEYSIKVKSVGTAYDYDMDEIASSQMSGMPLEARKAMAARRGYEEYINSTSWYGDEEASLPGFYSDANQIRKQSVAAGASTKTTWKDKTPDEIIADLNQACSEMYAGTKKIHKPDFIWMPVALWNHIRSTPRSAVSDTTILNYFLQNNIFITSADAVKPLNALDGAIAEGDHFVIGTMKTPEGQETVRIREPLPLQFLPVQLHGLVYEVPGRGRFAGCQVTYPRALDIWYGI